jgi:hypothetical protein
MGRTPRVEIVTAEQGEQADVLVCVEWTSPPLLPGNQRARCGVCGCLVQHRPDAPRKPMRVCVGCTPSVIRGQ